MGIILWIIFGALTGWAASLIMKTDAQQGAVMNIMLGIVGAFVGGLLMNLMGYPGVTGFDLYSLAVAIAGAAIVIGLVRVLR
ncbi:hypothetical protein A2Z33_07260 [Candidatus Gottesmanbacteria bacterium RBG_16_52_11]|uniref:Transglycosylase n=1 Tax=Candidatus Gottesmanbacteria bacterium RBG_16_52_11 TaxID=1798374 RepID=A0A1F5YXX8_9BACT|nr:MAG: hypothetical protein A2Z33_07260 [Candidatus Gottesmanbacteria bacterium RBG_16_52_11]